MKKTIRRLFRLLLLGAALWLGALLVRIFVCDRFIVPSDSMAPTLVAGDRILANKLIVGARIYRRLEFGCDIPLHAFRMPGVRRVRPGDVVVFNAPHGYDRGRIEFRINYVYSKRCIGAPGDTIAIRDAFFRNSSHPEPLGDTLAQRRLRETPDSLLSRRVLRAMPYDGSRIGWTIKEMGPLIVPRRGLRIPLDTLTCPLYRTAIEYETGKTLQWSDGTPRLGGEPQEAYSFRGDWYFFCGDNVADSKDSRYLGFVPEEFIIGVVRRIGRSEEPGSGHSRPERRWKRVE